MAGGKFGWYMPKQAERIFKYVPKTTEYFFVLGPANGGEGQHFHKEFPDVKIIGFEPSTVAFNFQRQNGFPGELYPQAIYSKNCKLELTTVASEINHMFLRDCWHDCPHDPTAGYEVDAITLDSFLEDHPEIDNVVLWADIEFAEYDMLLGATEFMKRVSCMNIELCDDPKNPTGYMEKCRELLDEMGFEEKEACGLGRPVGKKHWRGDYIFARK